MKPVKFEENTIPKQLIKKEIEKALTEIQDIDLTNYNERKANQKKVQNIYDILFDLKDKLK